MNTRTYKDYPEFYNNDFVKKIAKNEKWTVSDKDKRPLDMKALIEKNKIWGMAWNRGYNPLVDLNTLTSYIPDATNNAYYLDAETDGFIVIDIEPKCPDVIKQEFKRLPYLYGELSMSGNGYHLVFELPIDLWDKYPIIHNKMVMKETHGYYEILLNHMVTFTRNVIPHSDQDNTKDISEFRNIFEKLASEMKETKTTDSDSVFEITEIETDNIPFYGQIMTVLNAQIYKKKSEDFNNDMSRYEFGMAGFYYRNLERLLKNENYKNTEFTDEQKAIIIYELLTTHLEYREKHDTKRNNMPWLLNMAMTIISRNKAGE